MVRLAHPAVTPEVAPRWARLAPALVVISALLLGGCGGVKFVRNSGAHKYRALPVGTDIQVVGSALQLPQPTATIGTLRWKQDSKTDAKADEAQATEKLKRFAARYGCDAIVGFKSETASKEAKRKVSKLGKDGKKVWETRTTTIYTHTYTASCVRTAKAPGGLVEGSGQVAKQDPASMPGKLPKTGGDDPNETKGGETKGGGDEKKAAKKVDEDVAAIWLALSAYSRSYLKNWADALAKPAPSAHEVLAAFNELMVQVTGPTGIWRKTVPMEWFGCTNDPKQEQCKKLANAVKEFRPWEAFQRQLERQGPGAARGYIKRNKRRLLGYLERYVPMQPNLTGLQQTQLYIDKVR